MEALKELEDEARELQSLAELEGEPIAVDLSSGRASRSRRRGPAPVVDSAAPPSVAPQPPIAQQLPALVQAQVHRDAPQSNIESEAANLEMNELPSSHAGLIVEENNPTDLGALASPEISASMEAALQTQVAYRETQMSQIPSSPAPPHYIVSILPPPILEIQLGLEAYSEVASSRSSFFQIDRLDP